MTQCLTAAAQRRVNAVFFNEPVDQYARVRRHWREVVVNRNDCAMFLRSRPGYWVATEHAWTIKYQLSGSCEFELDGRRCAVPRHFAIVVPEDMGYYAALHDGCALSAFGAPLCRGLDDHPTTLDTFGIFALNPIEARHIADIAAELQRGAAKSSAADVGLKTASQALPLPQIFAAVQQRLRRFCGADLARRRLAARMVRARHALLTDFDQAGACSRAAAVASLTRSHFSRLFSRLFGASPRQSVVQHRQHVAQALFAEGGRSVAEVAAALGYDHPSSLSHLFKRAALERPRNLVARQRSSAPRSG